MRVRDIKFPERKEDGLGADRQRTKSGRDGTLSNASENAQACNGFAQ